MNTTAKIRPSRGTGVAGIFGGLLAIFAIAPCFYFVGSHVPFPHGELIALFPVAIGIFSIVSGVMTLSGKAPFGEDLEFNNSSSQEAGSSRTIDRLAEIENLKNRGVITPEEYAAKRQEILKDL